MGSGLPSTNIGMCRTLVPDTGCGAPDPDMARGGDLRGGATGPPRSAEAGTLGAEAEVLMGFLSPVWGGCGPPPSEAVSPFSGMVE